MVLIKKKQQSCTKSILVIIMHNRISICLNSLSGMKSEGGDSLARAVEQNWTSEEENLGNFSFDKTKLFILSLQQIITGVRMNISSSAETRIQQICPELTMS